MDIHSICRICLEYLQNDKSYDLFLVPGLAKKLCMCTSLSVEPQDGFPKNICDVCYTRLSDMAEFKKLCIDSVKKFQDMVANNTVVYQPTFDHMEAPAKAIQLAKEENENLDFDPLLTNPKIEMLENEDDVFKMLETVDKEVEEISPKIEKEVISEESSEEDKDSDEEFQFENCKRIPVAERHRIIECHICHRKFRKTKNFEKHMKYHNEKLPFQCEVGNCKRGFTTAHGLRLHVEHCHDETVHKIPCTQEGCDMKFPRRRILNWHLKRVHNIAKEDVPKSYSKSYPCTECEKVFKWPMALKKHMVEHTGQEPSHPSNFFGTGFVCQYCGKHFGKSNACKMHEMTHTGEVGCECKVCGRRFLYQTGLTEHLKTHEKRVPEDSWLGERVDATDLASTANPIPQVVLPSWSTQINFMLQESKYTCSTSFNSHSPHDSTT